MNRTIQVVVCAQPTLGFVLYNILHIIIWCLTNSPGDSSIHILRPVLMHTGSYRAPWYTTVKLYVVFLDRIELLIPYRFHDCCNHLDLLVKHYSYLSF